MDLFSDDARRNPYPAYAQLRAAQPVLHEPRSGLWMVFDYAGVRRMLTDFDSFSSRHGPDWMIFQDPPRHTKLRALVSRAFTPRSVAAPRAADRRDRRATCSTGPSRATRARWTSRPTSPFRCRCTVIAEMLGIPPEDRPRFVRWNDVILRMSYTDRQRDAGRQAARPSRISW